MELIAHLAQLADTHSRIHDHFLRIESEFVQTESGTRMNSGDRNGESIQMAIRIGAASTNKIGAAVTQRSPRQNA